MVSFQKNTFDLTNSINLLTINRSFMTGTLKRRLKIWHLGRIERICRSIPNLSQCLSTMNTFYPIASLSRHSNNIVIIIIAALNPILVIYSNLK